MKKLFLATVVAVFVGCACSDQKPVGIVYPPEQEAVLPSSQPEPVVYTNEFGRFEWAVADFNGVETIRSSKDFASKRDALYNYKDVRASLSAYPVPKDLPEAKNKETP